MQMPHLPLTALVSVSRTTCNTKLPSYCSGTFVRVALHLANGILIPKKSLDLSLTHTHARITGQTSLQHYT